MSRVQSRTISHSHGYLNKRFANRLFPFAIVSMIVLIFNFLRTYSEFRFANEAFVTGYGLLSVVLGLSLLGVRKQRTTWTIGHVAVWQRAHHYLGLASVGIYALHAKWITTGWLESLLAIAFWSIALSGMISWYVNRSAPKLLRAAGPQILRQDIESKRREVGTLAYGVALEAAGKSDSAVLADHYRDNLQRYFAVRRNPIYRVWPTGATRRRLLTELENLDRYLDSAGRTLRQTMSKFVCDKDDLDFQSAVQNRVRFWANAHTWLLGAFLVLTVAHVVSAHQFSSHW